MQGKAALEETIAHLEKMRAPRRLATDAPLDAQQTATLERAAQSVETQGYAIIEDFLDQTALERMRAEMEPIFAMTGNRDTRGRGPWPGIQAVHVHNLFAKTRAADAVAVDPLVLALLERILGPQFQMSVATAMCPRPGAEAQGFHQDDGHWPVARPHPPFVVNTLIALDDFLPETGATRLVPESHRRVEPIDPDTTYIHAVMPAGALLAWDGALWHAGGANVTRDRVRRSINLNYNLSWLRQQENQYLGIPRDLLLSLPEPLQCLLGYRKANHLCGSVDYQDPLDYVRKATG